MYNEKGGSIYESKGSFFVRNRGYKYIINNNDSGFLLFCINGPWINQMLKDRGIEPRLFRALNWRDIAKAQPDMETAILFERLRPSNFWEMCDVFALAASSYDKDFQPVYERDWFIRYPIFTKEDVYEILSDQGIDKSDAIKISEIMGRGRFTSLEVSFRDFIELCDVPEDIEEALLSCKKLSSREDAVNRLLDAASRAIYELKGKRLVETDDSGSDMLDIQ